MEKELKEYRIKELKSRKKWDKIENGFWFILQSYILSMLFGVAIVFIIRGLGLEVKTSWVFLLACWMLVIVSQSIYMMTKENIRYVKEIDDKYKELEDKLKD